MATDSVHGFLLDWSWVLSLVYGGCCTNAWTLEHLLSASTSIGSALTFFQMAFIALQGLPSFMISTKSFPYVGLRPRVVPISQWSLQVLVLWSMSILNNMAFAYDVPLTLQIVFRSGGLAVSMLFGYFRFKRRYSVMQILSIIIVTSGVIVTTVTRPSKQSDQNIATKQIGDYATGVFLLTVALVLTGYFGTLQERTYSKYGPCWKEGLFYTHFLSIPLFIPLTPLILNGLTTLFKHSTTTSSTYFILSLPLNLLSQLSCVSGVNMLTARLSSVSTNLVLTSRKAVSLLISVVVFGSPWNRGMALGSAMVGLGTVMYGMASRTPTEVKVARVEVANGKKNEKTE